MAIKTFKKAFDFGQAQEIAMMQKLNHENVVELITTKIVEETLGVALIMEYADDNLQNLINFTPNGKSDEFRPIGRSLLSAMHIQIVLSLVCQTQN